ncbi:MAG: Gfo/Idh/MocA family oxidoreductase [Ruminococcus sp.]|nr:Gfo/Idh/MocA family oxidoreductase [Ruminococcus sp.]
MSYKWGIIGTGRIARSFAAALKGTCGAELYAVASRTGDKARAFANEFGFEKAYGSYKELAVDSEVDVVYIATPMSSHFDDAMLCLENGRNVLCEKTLTLNSSQLERVLDKAAEKNLFFMEAMWMKCRPSFLKAVEWVQSGRIGKVEFIKADFNNFMPYDPKDRVFALDCGGGALLDLGVYPITFAVDFLGMPEKIESCAHIRHGVDLSNSVTLKYPEGVFALLSSGFEVQNRNNAVISGTDGSVTLGDWFFCSDEAVLYDKDGNEVDRFDTPAGVNGYEYEVMEVQRCLDQGLTESFLVPYSSTVNVLRIMDRCRRDWGMFYPGEDPEDL